MYTFTGNYFGVEMSPSIAAGPVLYWDLEKREKIYSETFKQAIQRDPTFFSSRIDNLLIKT